MNWGRNKMKYSFNTTAEISKRMSKQKAKKNKTEVFFAKYLWHKGLRYRYNDIHLPGSPDIVITKYRIAIFIDGEFWHGKLLDEGRTVHQNTDYWVKKIKRNQQRDLEVNQKLYGLGWHVVHFWSRDVMNHPEACYHVVMEFVELSKAEQEEI